jgi:hypothetical protein
MGHVSRRAAIGRGGTVLVVGLAGCTAVDLSGGPNERPPESVGSPWTPPADEWRFPRANLQNTARSTQPIRTQPARVWQRQQGNVDSESQSAHLVGATRERVVAAIERDAGIVLSGYDGADGTRQWRRPLRYPQGRRYPRFGGLVDGTLYLTDGGTDVVAVETADGAVRWRRNLYEHVATTVPDEFLTRDGRSPDSFSPQPLATPETVYVQTGYGLHGLAPADGREQWRVYLADSADNAQALDTPAGLALTDDQVWASYGGPTAAVYLVERHADSLSVEHTTAPVRHPGPPVVTNDGDVAVGTHVVWSTDTGGTLAFGVTGDPDTSWQFPGLAGTGPTAYSSLATDGDRVFVCEGHETRAEFAVFAVRAATGGIDWIHRASIPGRTLSMAAPAAFRLCQPAVAGETLLVGYGVSSPHDDDRGTLVGLSADAGRERWRTALPVAPKDVAVAGSRLFVSGQRHGLVAVSDAA